MRSNENTEGEKVVDALMGGAMELFVADEDNHMGGTWIAVAVAAAEAAKAGKELPEVVEAAYDALDAWWHESSDTYDAIANAIAAVSGQEDIYGGPDTQP